MLYELLHGQTPYEGDSLEKIRDQVNNKVIRVKKSISTQTKDLLKNLL